MIHPVDIKAMSMKRIAREIGPMTTMMTPEAYRDALVKVWTTGKEKHAKRFLRNQYEYLKQLCKQSKNNEAIVFPGFSAKYVVREVSKAAVIIAKAWKKK